MEKIVAVVTVDAKWVQPGGAPTFIAKDLDEREKISMYLSRLMDAQVHDLENGTYVLVQH